MKKLGMMLLVLCVSSTLQASTIVKCENRFGDISYAEDTCPYGSTQLSKTNLKPYKTSQAISQKDLQKAKAFPEQSSSSKEKAILVARLSKVLSSLAAIKVKVAEFYMRTDVWPESFHIIELDPKTLNSSLIKKTLLDKNGRIKVELNEQFGEYKQLWLYPQGVMGNTQVEWSCYTNFPSSMLKAGGEEDICLSRQL